MKTSLVALLLAAATLLATPPASAEEIDLVCLNSGADCLYIEDSQDVPAVCVRTSLAGTECTPSDDVPDYQVDDERGVCEPERDESASYGYYYVSQSCLVGTQGVLCSYYSSTPYDFDVGYACLVAIAPEDHDGSLQHAVCYGYAYSYEFSWSHTNDTETEEYVICLA